MIFVDRSAVPEPAILCKPFGDGRTETERAIEHYDPATWDGESGFDFQRYKHEEVKDRLEELFHGKCAYCESDFRHVSPEDIEHWRPKGAVVLEDGSERKPGYYWLAATWSNLLPSCIDCNRRRRQEDVREPANEQSGKKNLFPVACDSHRWTHPQQPDRNGEEPLILDPCVDQPDRFLAVDTAAVVREKELPGTRANLRAAKSIAVFGLDRKTLVDERKKHRHRVVALFRDIRLYVCQLPLLPAGPVRDETRDALIAKLTDLKAERGEASPYLLMKAPLIDEFMSTMGPKLEALGLFD